MRRQTFLSVLVGFLITSCGSDPGKLGDSCEPGEKDQCVTGLVCDAGAKKCLGTLGYKCTTTSDEVQCEAGRDCIEVDGAGQCSLLPGDVCDPLAPKCPSALVCADTGTQYQCFPPVLLEGSVHSTADNVAIAGAHVIALNEEKVPVTDVAVTDAEGAYSLPIPVARDANGAPTAAKFTLRAGAADYLTFPKGIRPALPIDTTIATQSERGWIISSTLTEIGLIPLATPGLPKIMGSVEGGLGGVLIVAEQLDSPGGNVVTGAGSSGLTDRSGAFTIFSVPDGEYSLRGYRADVQLVPQAVTVSGADITDVVLGASSDPTAEVSGNIINNSPDFSDTSVVLIPESVFDDVYVRGEVPPGLRAPRFGSPDVTTAFTITGVPDGDYVVLAAFENDGLVRDESGGGNTEIVYVTVPDSISGRTIGLASGFKVRSGLEVVGPGTDLPQGVGDGVNTSFDLTWGRYSNAKRYDLVVINTLGEAVWDLADIPQPGGNTPITVTYAGPALSAGMYYQFRVTAWDETTYPAGNIISRTEDLRGVFFLAP